MGQCAAIDARISTTDQSCQRQIAELTAFADRSGFEVLHAIDGGKSYRWIARDLGISKNTVADIVQRHRENP